MTQAEEQAMDDMAQEALAESQDKGVAPRTLRDKVAEAVAGKLAIEEHEAAIKALKKDLNQLLTSEIPIAMNEIGTTVLSFTIGNHQVDLNLEYKCRGTINSAPDIEAAVAYLVEHGFEGAIKTKASVDFTEGEIDDETLSDLATEMGERFDKDLNLERKIHPQTLMSFVRTMIEENPNFDPGKVGATVMREATLKIK